MVATSVAPEDVKPAPESNGVTTGVTTEDMLPAADCATRAHELGQGSLVFVPHGGQLQHQYATQAAEHQQTYVASPLAHVGAPVQAQQSIVPTMHYQQRFGHPLNSTPYQTIMGYASPAAPLRPATLAYIDYQKMDITEKMVVLCKMGIVNSYGDYVDNVDKADVAIANLAGVDVDYRTLKDVRTDEQARKIIGVFEAPNASESHEARLAVVEASIKSQDAALKVIDDRIDSLAGEITKITENIAAKEEVVADVADNETDSDEPDYVDLMTLLSEN